MPSAQPRIPSARQHRHQILTSAAQSTNLPSAASTALDQIPQTPQLPANLQFAQARMIATTDGCACQT